VFGGGAAVGLPGKFDFLPTKEQEGLCEKERRPAAGSCITH